MGYVLDGEVDVVTNEGAYAQEDQEEDERKGFPGRIISILLRR